MFYDEPRSILKGTSCDYFEVDGENLFIGDPCDTKPPQLLGERLLSEGSYWPFIYFKAQCRGYDSLILFASSSPDQIIVWRVHHDSPIAYAGQFCVPSADLRFLIGLSSASISEVHRAISRSSSDAPPWARKALAIISNSLTSWTSLEECLLAPSDYKSLNDEIFSSYISSVNSSTASLIDYIYCRLPESQSKRIISLLDAYHANIRDDFVVFFAPIAHYCVLRELFCVVTGRHVCLDPFTGQHVVSDGTLVCACNYGDFHKDVKSRLMRYRSSLGYTFIERRGPAWLDVTSSVILPDGFIVNVVTGQQWGPRIIAEEVQWVKALIEGDSLPVSNDKPQYLTSEVESGKNIGHVLWNEISGYVEFILICQQAGWWPKEIAPILAPSNPTYFSKFGVRSFLYPFIHKALQRHLDIMPNDTMVKEYMETIAPQGLSSHFVEVNQPVSFRYPRLSRLVANTICEEYPSVPQYRIRLYKNIRFHSKSHTNPAECLRELFEELLLANDQRMHPANLVLDLEFSDRDQGCIDRIEQVCKQYRVCLNLCERYEMPDLLALVSAASVCIVPIGSGAVLPSWVFRKHTVLHSEVAHQAQLSWWHLAGNIDLARQYPIPGHAIHDDPVAAGQPYCNYSVEPHAYARTVIKALHDYCAGIPDGPIR